MGLARCELSPEQALKLSQPHGSSSGVQTAQVSTVFTLLMRKPRQIPSAFPEDTQFTLNQDWNLDVWLQSLSEPRCHAVSAAVSVAS